MQSFDVSVCFVPHPCNQLNTSLALLILFLDNENDHTRKADVFFDILCSCGMKDKSIQASPETVLFIKIQIMISYLFIE